MKRILLASALMLLLTSCFSQMIQQVGGAGGIQANAIKGNNMLIAPSTTDNSTGNGAIGTFKWGTSTTGALLVNTTTLKMYYMIAGTWYEVGTGSGHAAVTLGTANGLSLNGQELSLAAASAGTTGALTSTDWSTFNNKVPPGRQLTINGTTYDLSANRTWTIPTHDAVTLGTANGLSLSGQQLSLGVASTNTTGALTSTDWNTFNNKQSTITLTTTGSSGAATFSANTLNIPNYTLAGLGGVAGSGFASRFTYWVDASNLGYASAMYYDNANGRVGIGTTSPAAGYRLDVYDGIITGSDGRIGLLGGTTNYLFSNSSTTVGGQRLFSIGNGFTWQNSSYSDLFTLSNAGVPLFTGLAGTGTRLVQASATGQLSALALSTTSIPEGTNLYYTDARARAAISLTTTGSSGLATYSNTTGVLNIPNYSLSGLGGVPTSRQLTINGTTYDLSADRTWSIPTHDAVTLGTANGLSLSGQQLSLGTASAGSTGALTSTDWSTFNNKVGGSGASGQVGYWNGTNTMTGNNNLFWDATNARLGINTNAPNLALDVRGDFVVRQSGSTPQLQLYANNGGSFIQSSNSGGTAYSSMTLLASSWTANTYDGLTRWSVNGSGVPSFNGLSGTGTRVVLASNTGQQSALANGNDGQVLKLVSGAPAWANETGGGGTPAGNSGEVQFNSGGSFGASSSFFWDNTNKRLAIGNTTSPQTGLHLYRSGTTWLQNELVTLRMQNSTNSSQYEADAIQFGPDIDGSTGIWGISVRRSDNATWQKLLRFSTNEAGGVSFPSGILSGVKDHQVPGSGGLTVSTMRWVNSDKDLVIGQQYSDNFSGALYIGVDAVSDANSFIQFRTGNRYAGGTNLMRMHNNGIIQIGGTTASGTKKLQVEGGARISDLAGTGERVVTASSTGELQTGYVLVSGTYSPTVSAGTAYGWTYSRNGDVVSVAGKIVWTPSNTDAAFITITLPVNGGTSTGINGTAAITTTSSFGSVLETGAIYGDSNDLSKANLVVKPGSTSEREIHVIFQYIIVN